MRTFRYRPTRKSALAGLVAGLLLAGAAQAATINVNTVNDIIADDGSCSLREAVIAANTNTASGASAGECAAGTAGLDDIVIPAGTYTLSIAPEDATPIAVDANTWQVGEYTANWMTSTYVVTVIPDATKGDLDITESVNLVGAGKDLTIVDGGWVPVPWDVLATGFDPKVDPVDDVTSDPFGDRIFHVVSEPLGPTESVTINVQMSGLTVKGGKLETITGLVAPDTKTYSLRRGGGGISTTVAGGTYDPAAESGGGSGGSGAPPIVEPGGEEGGATYTLGLSNLAILSNYAGDGGGLYSAATATASNLTVSGNRGNANGGGIYNDAVLTLTNSSISGNSSEGGGALFDTGSHVTDITGSTLSANGAVGGGGISSRSGVTINMVNSTVSGNYGFDVGGGIYTNGYVNLMYVSIANNVTNADSAGAGAGINTFPSGMVGVTLRNTLLANNLAGTDPATRLPANCGATGGTASITSGGHNLSSDASCNLFWAFMPGDLESVDPKILPLAANGGPTMTHALDATSPAINAAAAVSQLTVDQRGTARDSTPDIGAYEYVAVSTLDTSDGGGGGNGGCLFTANRGGGGPVDPTLPALVITAAMFLALSRAGLRRRQVLVR